MTAPVSVARLITAFGLKRSCAYQRQSASTMRPSASVLSTSIVCPDIAVTTSPGRCALPLGMFSTRPMMPTALTFALRAASSCMRPTTQAAPAMSPFMSSMPAAGLSEMPPVSKVTPLPTKTIGSPPFGAGALPLHHHDMTRLHAALPDGEQRIHAELCSVLRAEHLDLHAELGELLGALSELGRPEHVGRLVDEIAREHHAVGEGAARPKGLVAAFGSAQWITIFFSVLVVGIRRRAVLLGGLLLYFWNL